MGDLSVSKRMIVCISVGIIGIAALAAFGIFGFFGDKEEALEIPKAERIERIELEHINGGALNTVVRLDDSKVDALIDDINSKSVKTGTDSVSDAPVGVDYIIVNCYLKDGGSMEFYIYQKGKAAFAEWPYRGIREIPVELYRQINNNKDEIIAEYKD